MLPVTMKTKRIPAAIKRIPSYDFKLLLQSIDEIFTALQFEVRAGARVLVKPNLVTPRDALAVTSPVFVKALCAWLLDQGARVLVGDSPAFGSARRVAQKSGLMGAIQGLPVTLAELDSPVSVKLASGLRAGISRHALGADLIVNCPRLKAHCQAGITAGVKNLFGCVSGFRKAFAHCLHGDVDNRFESLVVDLLDVLPSGVTVVDAIESMHVTGPSGGLPCHTGFVCASPDPVAADTVIYRLLGADSELLPLYREIVARRLPGSSMEDIELLMDGIDTVDCTGFRLPDRLKPFTFNPARLLKGRFKSLLMRL